MENLDINIKNARMICSGEIELDKKDKIDTFSSINICAYFRYFDFTNKRILTVGKSCDEVFNASFYGAKDISLIDDNPYTLYLYYLKLTSMYSLSYQEFEWFFYKYTLNKHLNNKMFSKKLFEKVKPVLKDINSDTYYFFNELFNEFDNRIVRDKLFNNLDYHNKVLRCFNIYLKNNDTYTKTKKLISDIKFNFINKNILTNEINDQYDFINLSSLCTNTPIYKMINLFNQLNDNNLNDDGLMILGYLWKNNMYTEDYLDDWKKVYNDPNANGMLNDYITAVFYINGYRDYLWEDNKKEDRVLVYRKK